jgi:hypothetical protein
LTLPEASRYSLTLPQTSRYSFALLPSLEKKILEHSMELTGHGAKSEIADYNSRALKPFEVASIVGTLGTLGILGIFKVLIKPFYKRPSEQGPSEASTL